MSGGREACSPVDQRPWSPRPSRPCARPGPGGGSPGERPAAAFCLASASGVASYQGGIMTLSTSYWPADRSQPVLDLTVGDALRDAAAKAPHAIALVEGAVDPAARRRWSYAELLEASERAARALLGRFAPGDRVAVWASNIPEWVILELAAGLAGITIVTVNPALRPQELAYVLGQSQADGVFLVPAYRGSAMAEMVQQVRGDLPALREVVSFAGWDAFCAEAAPGGDLPEVSPRAPAQIQYTSGTGRGVHPRLSRDDRLLPRPRQDSRRHRRRRLAAHRRPGLDGRAGLLPDRRAAQGHDHRRRREHLPARDRAGPVRAPHRGRRRRGRSARPEMGRAGRRVRAPARGQRPDPGELFAYCREHLAPHKTPRYWTVVEQFPLTPSGKVQKFVLRERFLAQGPDVAIRAESPDIAVATPPAS